MKTNITPDLIRAALQHIPANLARDEWARVGMAIKSEFPDEGGYDLFFEWSATAPDFSASNCRTAWKSFKAGGSVTMGSLIHLAKQNGYVVPKDGQAAAKPSPEVLARMSFKLAEAFAAVLDEKQARQVASRIRVDGETPRITTSDRAGKTLYRVVLGPYPTRADADRVGKASGQSYWIFEGAP